MHFIGFDYSSLSTTVLSVSSTLITLPLGISESGTNEVVVSGILFETVGMFGLIFETVVVSGILFETVVVLGAVLVSLSALETVEFIPADESGTLGSVLVSLSAVETVEFIPAAGSGTLGAVVLARDVGKYEDKSDSACWDPVNTIGEMSGISVDESIIFDDWNRLTTILHTTYMSISKATIPNTPGDNIILIEYFLINLLEIYDHFPLSIKFSFIKFFNSISRSRVV